MFSVVISTLLSLQKHPAACKHPVRLWLSGAETHLFNVAETVGGKKEDIAMFTNMKSHCNYAFLILKFNFNTEPADSWLNLQKKLLDPI